MDDDLGNLDDVHYDGSRIFSGVAELFGISVDLVRKCLNFFFFFVYTDDRGVQYMPSRTQFL